MRTIPHRDLQKELARVLRQVEAGEPLRITVDGRPVADLVPIRESRRTFVPREEVVGLLGRAPLDSGIAHDVDDVAGATIDEL